MTRSRRQMVDPRVRRRRAVTARISLSAASKHGPGPCRRSQDRGSPTRIPYQAHASEAACHGAGSPRKREGTLRSSDACPTRRPAPPRPEAASLPPAAASRHDRHISRTCRCGVAGRRRGSRQASRVRQAADGHRHAVSAGNPQRRAPEDRHRILGRRVGEQRLDQPVTAAIAKMGRCRCVQSSENTVSKPASSAGSDARQAEAVPGTTRSSASQGLLTKPATTFLWPALSKRSPACRHRHERHCPCRISGGNTRSPEANPALPCRR